MFHFRHKILYLFLLLGVFVSQQAFAAPRLKVESPAGQIRIGQSAVLRIQLEWPQTEGSYEIHSGEPKLENLTLEKQNQSQSISVATVTQILTYEFRPLKKGPALIDPFEIRYRKTGTEPWIPVLVPEQKIKVISSLPIKATLIGLGFLASLSALIFVSFRLWTFLKVREAAKNVPLPDPKQRVYAKAEESIATFTSPEPKEKLTHWSHLLRTVVVTYYDLPCKTATSAEVLSFLRAKSLARGEWNEISRLMEQLTEMQYSRTDIPARELEHTQKTLLQYVKGKIIIEKSD